jgi:hypothetical protein
VRKKTKVKNMAVKAMAKTEVARFASRRTFPAFA